MSLRINPKLRLTVDDAGVINLHEGSATAGQFVLPPKGFHAGLYNGAGYMLPKSAIAGSSGSASTVGNHSRWAKGSRKPRATRHLPDDRRSSANGRNALTCPEPGHSRAVRRRQRHRALGLRDRPDRVKAMLTHPLMTTEELRRYCGLTVPATAKHEWRRQ
jgi:hypothetical protein